VRHRSEATQRALIHLKMREALVRSRVNPISSVRVLFEEPWGVCLVFDQGDGL
jgi:hypothetical protein